ncbi:MAG: hypothetical protein ABW217_12720 [Polyangiaceae bacterium]
MPRAFAVALWFVLRVLLHVAVIVLVALALLLRIESPPGVRPAGYARHDELSDVRPR